MEKIIKNCRRIKKCHDDLDRTDKQKERENFRSILGFKENDIYERKEYSIKKVFVNETIIEQHKVYKYFIDLVFLVHGKGIEIDKSGHLQRSDVKEEKREIIKEKTGFEIIRINPHNEGFDIFDEIGRIQTFISNSNKR